MRNLRWWKKDEHGQRGSQTRLDLEAKLLVVSTRGVVEDRCGRLPVAWFVQPGDWAKYYLVDQRQTALLARKVLEYDPVRCQLEKRFGFYLAIQTRIGGGESERTYQVRTLLRGIGKTVDQDHPSRTRERFKKALDRLTDDGVITGWHYVVYDENALAKRGWVQDWLNEQVIVFTPQVLQDHYARIRKPNGRRRT